MFKKTPKQKADSLEARGEKLLSQKQWQKAYSCFHEAIEIDDTRVRLYDKLLNLLDSMKENWTEEHFAHSVHWQMKKQEHEDPKFRRINARAEPEFQQVMSLIKNMMETKTESKETECVEKIAGFGPDAVYPLIDMLLAFKEAGKK